MGKFPQDFKKLYFLQNFVRVVSKLLKEYVLIANNVAVLWPVRRVDTKRTKGKFSL